MTRRRDLQRRRRSLVEIRGIMNSMKTLAYMETRKLTRFLQAQHAVVRSIEAAAEDLLSFHPDTLPDERESMLVYLLVGTERGFCGNFNQALLGKLEDHARAYPASGLLLIAIGRKLHTVLEDDLRRVAAISGPTVAEEVPSVLNQVADQIVTLQDRHGALTVFGLHRDYEQGVVVKKLLPPFDGMKHRPQRFAHPPLLHQSPRQVLVELVESYLFAALHEMLFTSLMAENHHRVVHLEGAVKHLDDKAEELKQRSNALRQEEIVEEIEVILLNAANLGEVCVTK